MRAPGANLCLVRFVPEFSAHRVAVRLCEMTCLTAYEVGNEKSQHADHIFNCVR